MRIAIVVIVSIGCSSSSGGTSVGPDDCEHTQLADSACCTLEHDCAATGAFCAPPGASDGCGACDGAPATCTTDADCRAQSATAICEPRRCACDVQKDCVPGCTSDAGCSAGEACDLTTNRCEPARCVDSTTCPQDFACIASRCLRKGCIASDDCDAFCVDGLCYQRAGECRLPSA